MSELLSEKISSDKIKDIQNKIDAYGVCKNSKFFGKDEKFDLSSISYNDFVFYCGLNKTKYEEKKKNFYYFIDGFKFLLFTVYFGGISAFFSDDKYFNQLIRVGIYTTASYIVFIMILKGFLNRENERIAVIKYIESILECWFNILEHIVDEIFLLEINSENYTSVEQYAFSNEREPKIKRVNITNYENEDYRSLVPPTEPQKNDNFQEFKEANNLQVFESPK